MADEALGDWPEPCEQEGCTLPAARDVAATGVAGGGGTARYANLHLCATHARKLAKRARTLRVVPLRPLSHKRLLGVARALPTDYAPWGGVERGADPDASYPDCSGGCRWFAALAGDLGRDWGVCASPTGPRAGMLTMEHQAGFGCFEQGEDDDTAERDAARATRARHAADGDQAAQAEIAQEGQEGDGG